MPVYSLEFWKQIFLAWKTCTETLRVHSTECSETLQFCLLWYLWSPVGISFVIRDFKSFHLLKKIEVFYLDLTSVEDIKWFCFSMNIYKLTAIVCFVNIIIILSIVQPLGLCLQIFSFLNKSCWWIFVVVVVDLYLICTVNCSLFLTFLIIEKSGG